jgi:hypothetical protein
MRYFPVFKYGKATFDLSSCRMVPDACSYYLLLFRKRRFSDLIYGTPDSIRCPCNINSVCASTPGMEKWMPKLRGMTNTELLANNPISLAYTKQGNRFFALLWFLLSTHYGAHEPQGIPLLEAMFQDVGEVDDSPPANCREPRPAIGLRIRVQLRSE